VGGISIPSGPQADPINRPGPLTATMTFAAATSLRSITTGNGLGGDIAGLDTDIITILMDDPFRDELNIEPEAEDPGDQEYPMLAEDGSYIDLGNDDAASEWAAGDLANGVSPIAEGDLIYFSAASGTTLQMVTEVTEDGLIRFEEDDDFNLNQPDATAGSITQILGAPMAIRRVFMFTYFIEEHEGAPRLMQRLNFHTPTALAGAVEDLQFTYDLVDGEYDPVGVNDLPYVVNQSTTLTATQIRKVNVAIGVRSELVDPDTQDYLRQKVLTVVSVRNLAFVSRYDLD
jgi:hypothetical protein